MVGNIERVFEKSSNEKHESTTKDEGEDKSDGEESKKKEERENCGNQTDTDEEIENADIAITEEPTIDANINKDSKAEGKLKKNGSQILPVSLPSYTKMASSLSGSSSAAAAAQIPTDDDGDIMGFPKDCGPRHGVKILSFERAMHIRALNHPHIAFERRGDLWRCTSEGLHNVKVRILTAVNFLDEYAHDKNHLRYLIFL